MSWRALLAALAVTCTFPRIHANGQSSQRLDRIKDLLCVLLLSGIQKEDLDASMLNKLQRYNVNIHDLNDNELLQECTKFQFLNNNKTPQTHNIENEIEKYNPKGNAQDTYNNYNLKNINEKEYNYSNKNLFENEKNKDEHAIQYSDGQPELQSILNFWKNIKNNNSIKTTETSIKLNTVSGDMNDVRQKEQKDTRNRQDTSNSNELNTLQKVLLNIISKSRNNNINKAPTKKTLKIEDLYSDFLNKQNDKKYLEINESEKTANLFPLKDGATKLSRYFLNNGPSGPKNKVQPKIPNSLSNRENTRPINTNNFNDIMNALQSFKAYYPIIPNDKSTENVNIYNIDKITSSEKIYFNKIREHENILATEKVIVSTITEQTLSQNLIKEIAKTVKELVLKDLRKEIFKTTSYPTTANILQTIHTTAKTGEIISPNKKENQNAERSILNKFIDLFEEIKTLNHKTLIISSEIRKESANKDESTYPVIPPPIFNDMEQRSYHKIKEYTDTNLQKTYDFSPQVHKFRSHVVSESTLQIPVKSTLPITVQTNNMEIPPIGIPIDNPENPINQNIIVSTMKPYRIGKYNFEHNKIKFPDTRTGEEYMPKQQIRFGKVTGPTNYYSTHKNDDSLSNKDHSNTSFNKKPIFNRFKESDRRGDEIKHSDIPRFHEQLERGMDYFDTPQRDYIDRDCCDERHSYSKQMVDCCNHKIASRQQMSLNNVKRQSSYDDTHFKNFLKSQQKVTDMLERILASRSRVRSVETA